MSRIDYEHRTNVISDGLRRTFISLPNSEGRAREADRNDAASQFDTATRRRQMLVRREAARGGRGNLMEAHGYSQKDVEAAANELLRELISNRINRQQVEADQRQDAQILAGWVAVQPDVGTKGAHKLAAIQYRMAVRTKALDEFDAYDLAPMISYSRDGQITPPQPAWKPWRKGAAPGSRSY